MNLTRAGVDIAKSVFHVHGVDRHDLPQWQAKLNRKKWLVAVCERLAPGAEVGMEGCAGAHHWARELQKRGFRVKLIAAQFVNPYVKSNKNDRVDAEAICEAMGRPGMRFVAVTSVEQQARQAAHRIREELISQRTAKANQIRGLVGEFGIVAPVGIHQLRRALPDLLENADIELTDDFRVLRLNARVHATRLDHREGQAMNPMNPMHSCKRVAEPLAQSMDEPLSWFDALRMRIHLSMCGNRRNVAEQVSGLQTLLKDLFAAADLPNGRGPATGPDGARAARPDG